MASRSSSDPVSDAVRTRRVDAVPAAGTDPHRPSDHIDAERPSDDITQPRLGPLGYLRFFWRQLTSMRTALVLLLLLAVAAVPGSVFPQTTSDPNGVVQYRENNPELVPVVEFFQLFDVYTSVWFSAIYLLLFVSLIGCIVPRTRHHLEALRSRPPKTPARLGRLPGFTSVATPAEPAAIVESAERLLRKQGYRVERYGDSVSAERGYLRETGNLIFHVALVGILVAVGIGSGFGYSGQKIIVEDRAFTNALTSYDSFSPGRFVDQDAPPLDPYTIVLDSFEDEYEENPESGGPQPLDYTANVTVATRDGEERTGAIRVNEPLDVGGTQVYLLGNGYAIDVTVRDSTGEVAYSGPVPFLPQDANLTSVGVVKVPDSAGGDDLGFTGFFYPSVLQLPTGSLTSRWPEAELPVLSLNLYTGDLGLDEGVPSNVYSLDVDSLEKRTGTDTDEDSLIMQPGDELDLPDGLGSITFEGVRRFVSLDIHHDPTQGWVLLFSVLVVGGLMTGLFIPRRRVWVKAVADADGTRIEYAGLARGDDPALERAVADLARTHSESLGGPPGSQPHEPRMTP